MSENYASHGAQEQAESHAPYLQVWAALLILTIAEYFWARFLAGSTIILIAGLLSMALVKAGLVGYYFMHVKYEGKWVYLLIIPAIFMATVVVMGLVPDVAFHEQAAGVPQAAAPLNSPAPETLPASS